ncbi:hypothetical protein, partial [Pricia sp.]|uniref:hypothetical protein n=1 Tax=Pricia sp. TaxID=2268138 RepID=UPI0035938920
VIVPSNLTGKNGSVDLNKMTYGQVVHHFGLEKWSVVHRKVRHSSVGRVHSWTIGRTMPVKK